ncbi:organic anion transporter 3-like [Babylonia areolata]|uniref:organic anion transporter 3-like n=1 Tax=Babylonia areolata TaxID=304850 RepID=UPI003FD01EAF
MTRVLDIDPVLNYLGPRGRFQLWQMMLVAMGGMCAQNQLFDIIFIGQDVPYRCAEPNVTSGLPDLPGVTATSDVSYGKCNIIVTNNVSNDISQTLECVYGYEYERDIYASFMSEFGLVCDRYVLVSLSQTILVVGQGFGAFGSSIISDRFGRKPVLLVSQLGLLLGGMAIGASPSYPVLVVFKFLVGACQQAVVAGISTLGIELFPRQHRSLSALIIALWWSAGGCGMALFAYLLRHHTWRVLQFSLSSLSLLMVLLQVVFMEESVRWLAANGRKKKVLRVLKRAARANNKLLGQVLATLHHCQQQSLDDPAAVLGSLGDLHPMKRSEVSLVIDQRSGREETGVTTGSTDGSAAREELAAGGPGGGSDSPEENTTVGAASADGHSGGKELTEFASQESGGQEEVTPAGCRQDGAEAGDKSAGGEGEGQRGADGEEESSVDKTLRLEGTRHLTPLDMWRHRTLRFNALLSFFAWFTVAFVVFTLFLMSTSYAGDPYLNYFLAALMEVPPGFLIYFGVDRLGRKHTVQGMFALAGFGCFASAICLMFPDDAILARMSAVFAMAGMLGGSGAFSSLFFYTPEYFPTNIRNQALGTGSTVGRIGGMIAPFMKNLAVIAMWAPSIISGSLCVLVVICVHFLPETRGRQLPTDIEDIEAWYSQQGGAQKETKDRVC